MDKKFKTTSFWDSELLKCPLQEKNSNYKKNHVHGVVSFPNENSPSSVLPSLSFSIKPTKNTDFLKKGFSHSSERSSSFFLGREYTTSL
jgi:hypothetical protein